MENRIVQLQKVMQKNKIDLTITRLPENVVLLCGYYPRVGMSYVVVPKMGNPCVICPTAELEDAKSGYIQDVRLYGTVRLQDGDAFKNFTNLLVEFKNENNIQENPTIGIELDFETFAPSLCSGELSIPNKNTQQAILNAFNGATITNILPTISELRKIKLPAEIEKIKLATEIGCKAVEYFKLIVQKENMREIDIAADVESYVAKFASGYKGVRFARAWAQVSSGLNTVDAWNSGIISTSKKLENQDLVMLEIGIVCDGYWADLTCTECVGGFEGEKLKMYEAVKLAQKQALDAIKPGVLASDIDKIARDTLKEKGYGEYFVHITGHGVGFVYHDGAPMITPTSTDILSPGMIHSVEPAVYIPGIGGVRLEVNSLVTENGYQILGI